MRELQLRKHIKNLDRNHQRDLIMEAEVFYRTAELPRVTGSNLDPQKHWNQAECFSKEKNTFCSASGSRGLGFRV